MTSQNNSSGGSDNSSLTMRSLKDLRELIKAELGDCDSGDPDRDGAVLKSVLECIRDHWSKPEEALGDIEFVIKEVFGEKFFISPDDYEADNSSLTMGSTPWVSVKAAQPAAGEIVWVLVRYPSTMIQRLMWAGCAPGFTHWCPDGAICLPPVPSEQPSITVPNGNPEPESFTD